MIERLEQQTRLTANQWKLIVTGNLADLLDFFDFFLIGYVLAFIAKEWQLTYWQGAVILLASGIGAVPGAFFWGWVADKIGRRKVFILTAINLALATAVMAFTPGPDGWIAGWLFLSIFRFFVGIGNAGLYAVDLPLVQEFMPAKKRGWVSALVTTLLPAGSLLGAILGAYLAPIIGWRGLFLIGLVPIVRVLMVRYWVPESPRWLIRMGRHEDARKSLAWALMVDPKDITLPTTLPEAETARWSELFKYPRSVIAGCLTGLTQTGGVGAALWGATLFVMVLNVSPAEASYLMIFVTISAIVGRFFITALIEPMGRRGSGILCGIGAAVFMILAGYLHDVFIVMGLAYGVGNSGKIIGPLGLALILGANDLIKPAANLDQLGPAFTYFAAWYVLGALAFWLIGVETKGRTFEEIDGTMSAPASVAAAPAAQAPAAS